MFTAVSLFSGVGGIDIGFHNTGCFKTIQAIEFDRYANMTFKLNFPNTDVIENDIREVDEILESDVILAGFPCTSFSIAGYRKGFEDEKSGDLFFHVLRLAKKTNPRIILLENVKNLVSHDNGKTFRIILDSLHENGYHVKYKIMNASEYGNVPQNRERIYIVCFRDEVDKKNFEFPDPIELKNGLEDMIGFNDNVDKKYYYTDKLKAWNLMKDYGFKPKTIYQYRRVYIRENKSNVCPTLTANMGTGGHNVPIIRTTDKQIRKLTPHECFNLQGFPKDYKLPPISDIHLYKQAGNSVVMPVIERIARSIVKIL